MTNVRFGAWRGRVGNLASLVTWLVSFPVLGQSLAANQAAAGRGLYHIGRGMQGPDALHARAVLWGLLFVLLQLLAPLLLCFTLRAFYRLRMAVCISITTACLLALDALGIFAMLVWLRIKVGVA